MILTAHTSMSTTVAAIRPLNYEISTLMKHGLVAQAQSLFDAMPRRDTVTHNAMIHGYFCNGLPGRALHLFDEMPERDLVSCNTVIAGLMQLGHVETAKTLFRSMFVRDVVTWNSMVSGFLINGLVDEAAQVFLATPVKNAVSWNSMISGCSMNGCVKLAQDLFWKMPDKDALSWHRTITELMSRRHAGASISLFFQMPDKCRRTWNSVLLGAIRLGLITQAHALVEKTPYSDVVSFTNLVIGYFEASDARSAVKAFHLMTPDKDSAAWNAAICRLGDRGEAEEALKLYIRMTRAGGAALEDCTFTSVLMICAESPTLNFGRQAHTQVAKTGFHSFTSACNALITMYARCGDMDSALRVFGSMEIRNVISWNSVICGYAHHGNGYRAIEAFRQMRLTGVRPNEITFIGLLSACAHAGLVQNGKRYFSFMTHKCFLRPATEHYTCIVDLCAKSGLLDDAVSFISRMEADGLEVGASVWGAVLGACRVHNETELGEIAATKVLEAEPGNSGAHMILAEMYSNAARGSDARRILRLMKAKGVKKQPGCSWIEVDKEAHIFTSGGCLYPHMTLISSLLGLMHFEMKIS